MVEALTNYNEVCSDHGATQHYGDPIEKLGGGGPVGPGRYKSQGPPGGACGMKVTGLGRTSQSRSPCLHASALMALSLFCDAAPQGQFAYGERCGKIYPKPLQTRIVLDILAEAVRFELTDPCEPPVFKTGAIDHSATLPKPPL